MQEQYSVGVKFRLADMEFQEAMRKINTSFRVMDGYIKKINEGLDMMGNKNIVRASREASKLNQQFTQMSMATDRVSKGFAAMGAAYYGAKGIADAVRPAADLTHQINNMNMAGLKQVEIAKNVSAAWKETKANLTTTATGNLESLSDLRNITGSSAKARALLHPFNEAATVMRASTNSKLSQNAQDLVFTAAKALDIRGVTNDPKEFQSELFKMARVGIATNARVLPSDYLAFNKYARQAKFGLSPDFLYDYLPTVLLENKSLHGGGGGSGGTGPQIAAMNRAIVQGIMTKHSVKAFQDLNLVPNSAIAKITKDGNIQLKGGLKDAALEIQNPYYWATQVLYPALVKKYGSMTKEQLQQHINELRLPQLATSALTEFILKQSLFDRDRRILEQTKSVPDAYQLAMKHDPGTASSMFSAQFTNLKAAIAEKAWPILIPGYSTLASGMSYLTDKFQNHPYAGLSLLGAAGAGTIAAAGYTGYQGYHMVKNLLSQLGADSSDSEIIKTAKAAVTRGQFLSEASLGARLGAVGAVGLAGLTGYGIGTWLDHEFSLSKKIGFGLYDWLHPNQENIPTNTPKQSSNKSQPEYVQVNIHLDGRVLATALAKYTEHNLYLSQVSSSNNFNLGMTAIAPNTGAPIR